MIEDELDKKIRKLQAEKLLDDNSGDIGSYNSIVNDVLREALR